MSKKPRAEFFLSAASPSGFPSAGLPEVAVVGRSNVGKSSLLNQLAGVRKLAAVSRTPGRTQLVNFFLVEDRLYLVDLPGYGFARAPVQLRKQWESLVTEYLLDRAAVRLVLLLVDARRDPMANDRQVVDLLNRSGISYVLIASKSDKLSRTAMARQRAKLEKAFAAPGGAPFITFSAVTGEGRKELWNVIEKHVREPEHRPSRQSPPSEPNRRSPASRPKKK
jgi:GTP-binding protein